MKKVILILLVIPVSICALFAYIITTNYSYAEKLLYAYDNFLNKHWRTY